MKKNVAAEQPSSFEFTDDNIVKAQAEIAKYPAEKEKSAVMPLLDIAQEQMQGWIPIAAMSRIASMLKMPDIEVFEVASFYSMYNTEPVGKYLVQVCRTTPCWLCSSEKILAVCKEFLDVKIGETTADKLFTLVEVECLGACIDAPVVQINKDYYENLTEEKIIAVLTKLKQAG